MSEKTQTTDVTTEDSWLVIITVMGTKYPTFVRASTIGEAHRKAAAKWRFLEGAHAYSSEAHVIGMDSLQDVMPDVKEVARAYWDAAVESCGLHRGTDVEDEYFEATWDVHGASLVDD